MFDETLIRSLGIIVVAAALFAIATRWIRMPSIVAYLLAGLAVGPVAALVELNEGTELISETGIALLLFLVGLELQIDKLRSVGRVALVAGLGQTAVTGVGGFLIARALGMPAAEAAVTAIALTFSSTVIAIKQLAERNELDSTHGRVAVGILLVQDLLVILLLTFMSGFDLTAGLSLQAISAGVLRAFGAMLLLAVVIMSASRWLLPRPFEWAARSPETLFVWSLAWCFLVIFGAELLHLSIEIGAFLAGVSLAQLPYNHELHRRVRPLMNFFLAVFFVSLGVRMQITPADVNWLAAAALTAFVIFAKAPVFIFLTARSGYSERASFMAAIPLSQISEFSLILGAAAAASGLMGPAAMSLLALVGLLTMAISSYAIQYATQLYALARRGGLLRVFRARAPLEHDEVAVERSGHVIVVGMNALGREIVQRLRARGERVLAIDTDPGKLRRVGGDTMLGSVEHVSLLEEAGLAHARLLVSALAIEELNDLLAFRCKTAGVPSAIHAIDLSVLDNLMAVDTTYLMIPKIDGIKLQTRELKRMGFLKE